MKTDLSEEFDIFRGSWVAVSPAEFGCGFRLLHVVGRLVHILQQLLQQTVREPLLRGWAAASVLVFSASCGRISVLIHCQVAPVFNKFSYFHISPRVLRRSRDSEAGKSKRPTPWSCIRAFARIAAVPWRSRDLFSSLCQSVCRKVQDSDGFHHLQRQSFLRRNQRAEFFQSDWMFETFRMELLTNILKFLLLSVGPAVVSVLCDTLCYLLHLSRQGDVPQINRSRSVVALWKSLHGARCTKRIKKTKS